MGKLLQSNRNKRTKHLIVHLYELDMVTAHTSKTNINIIYLNRMSVPIYHSAIVFQEEEAGRENQREVSFLL